MKENTVVAFQNPSDFQKDPLTEVLQAGARELLAQAVEAEVSVFLGSAESLCGFVESTVAPGSLIVTDDWSGYAGLGKRGYEHFAVAECGDPEVAEQYLPIIHLVFANLKTWLIGIHHGVSHQHLQAYLNEFTFRFNRRFYPFNAFRSLLGIAGDTSAPTYAELYSGEWRHPTCSGHGR